MKELTQREFARKGGLAKYKKYGKEAYIKMGKDSGLVRKEKKKAEATKDGVINSPIKKDLTNS